MSKMKNARIFVKEHDNLWFTVIVGPDDELLRSAFSSDERLLTRHLKNRFQDSLWTEGSHKLLQDMMQLYRGEKASTIAKFDFSSLSPFQRQVYKVLATVPKGKVTTYGLISRSISSAPRAVGGAIGSNPFPLFLPCHRIVPSDLTIGNYSMNGSPDEAGSQVKKKILQDERVLFDGNRIGSSFLWDPRE